MPGGGLTHTHHALLFCLPAIGPSAARLGAAPAVPGKRSTALQRHVAVPPWPRPANEIAVGGPFRGHTPGLCPLRSGRNYPWLPLTPGQTSGGVSMRQTGRLAGMPPSRPCSAALFCVWLMISAVFKHAREIYHRQSPVWLEGNTLPDLQVVVAKSPYQLRYRGFMRMEVERLALGGDHTVHGSRSHLCCSRVAWPRQDEGGS